MSFWPLGIRGKAIRLMNDAGFDVREPLAAELVEMLITQAKQTRLSLGTEKVDERVLVGAAAKMLLHNPTATSHLQRSFGLAKDGVDEALGRLMAEADRQNGRGQG